MGHAQLGAYGAHGIEDLATAFVARQALCRAIGCGDGIDHRGICCVVAHVLPPFILFCLTVRLTVLNIVDGSSILFLTQCQQWRVNGMGACPACKKEGRRGLAGLWQEKGQP